MRIRRSKEEISRVVDEFRASGLTKVEYSRRSGVPLSTLGNYCRRQRAGGLVRVAVEDTAGREDCFVVTLAGGRRIEIGSHFDQTVLVRLIRAVEAA
jgi:predicted transcriptional regulator